MILNLEFARVNSCFVFKKQFSSFSHSAVNFSTRNIVDFTKTDFVYELPHKLPNELRIRIIRN